MENLTELVQSPVVIILVHVVLAVAVFIGGRWLAKRARRTLALQLPKANLTPMMIHLSQLGAYYGILAAAALTALALIGVPLNALLTALLIVVAILGIALQQSISNLAATIVFLIFQPFRVGELVVANGVMGAVKEIQFFSTVLVTGDNKEVTIPNSKIQNDNLLNYTRLGRLRVDLVYNVSYSDDLDRVKQVLYELLAADDRVLADPPPRVFVQTLDDDAIEVAVRPWTTPEHYWQLKWDLPQRVRVRFSEAGITIPFPQRDVHLHTLERPGEPSGGIKPADRAGA